MKTKKKVVARKPKLEPWRAELARIVKFLNKNDDESVKLWLVLTAFRGPDSGKSEMKLATTGVLRRSVGLKSLSYGAVNEEDNLYHARVRAPYSGGDHFIYHLSKAFEVLGLKWGQVNETRK